MAMIGAEPVAGTLPHAAATLPSQRRTERVAAAGPVAALAAPGPAGDRSPFARWPAFRARRRAPASRPPAANPNSKHGTAVLRLEARPPAWQASGRGPEGRTGRRRPRDRPFLPIPEPE